MTSRRTIGEWRFLLLLLLPLLSLLEVEGAVVMWLWFWELRVGVVLELLEERREGRNLLEEEGREREREGWRRRRRCEEEELFAFVSFALVCFLLLPRCTSNLSSISIFVGSLFCPCEKERRGIE